MSVNLGTAYAELVLDSTKFNAGLATAEAGLKSFNSKASLVATGITGVGTAMSKVGSSLTKTITTPIAAVGAAAIKTGMDFDAGMSKVAAISGATGDDLDKLRAKAREMGASTKFTATEASEALNYMAMAGWKTEEMLEGLEGIMYLAAASGEDLGTTSDIVTDALTAFGMEAKDSSHFADVLAATAANANTNVSMMGETFKYAAPTAGALGYSIEDVAVAIGLMGNSGIKASRAGTALNNLFTRLAKPTKESYMAMDRLGISLYDDEGKMYSFMEIMQQLRESFGHINMPIDEFNRRVNELDDKLEDGTIKQSKYNAEMEELIKQAYGAEGAEKARAAAMLAGQRGMAGLLAIANSTEEEFNQLADAVNHASDGQGAAAEQAAIMMDNLKGKLTILKSAIQELGIQIYEIILPHIDALVEKAQQIVKWFQDLSKEQKEQIVKWAGIAAAIGPVLLISGKLLTSLGSIITTGIKVSSWLGSLTKAFGLVSSGASGAAGSLGAIASAAGPILAVVAAVTGLGVALKKLYDQGGQFTESVNKFKETIGNDIRNLIEDIKQAFENLKSFLRPIVDMIKNSFNFEAVDGAMSKLVDAFLSLYNALKPVIEFIVKALETILGPNILAIFSVLVGVINGIVEALAPAIEVITDAINIITDLVNIVVGLFEGIFTGDFSKLIDSVKSFGEDIVELFSDIIDTIVSFLGGFIEGVVTTIDSFTGGMATKAGEFLADVWESVKDFFANLWKNIKEFFTVTLPQAFNTAKQAIVDFFTVTIPRAIEKFVTETIPNFINSVVKWFEELPYKIGYAVGYALETIKQWGINLWNWVTTEIPRIIDEIIKFFKELPGKIWTWLVNTVNKVVEWGKQMLKHAIDTAKNFVIKVVEFIKELPGKVYEWIKNTLNKIITWGTEMVQKAKEIAKNFVDKFVEFVKELPGKVLDFIKSIPDKIKELGSIFYDAGVYILEHLWDGLKSVWSSISDWFDGVWDKISSFFRGVEDGMRDARDVEQEVSEGSHADGLSYVPYNGYRATLHEGERVLTKNEAQEYNKGSGTAYTINIYSPTQVDPYEANKIFKNTVRQLEEGFA